MRGFLLFDSFKPMNYHRFKFLNKKKMGKLKFQVLKKDLVDRIAIFTDTYADSTPSEVDAKERCDQIAKILDKNHIKFAVFDGNFYFEVSVEKSDKEKVNILANESKLPFWIRYLL